VGGQVVTYQYLDIVMWQLLDMVEEVLYFVQDSTLVPVLDQVLKKRFLSVNGIVIILLMVLVPV
jgi:hypothetical protein